MDEPDVPAPIDNGGIGQGAAVVAIGLGYGDHFRFPGQDRIIHSVLPHKLQYITRLLQGDAQKLQAVFPEFILQFDKFRDLFQAGRTPGCPEIQDQNLAVPLPYMSELTCQIRQGEGGPGLAEQLLFPGRRRRRVYRRGVFPLGPVLIEIETAERGYQHENYRCQDSDEMFHNPPARSLETLGPLLRERAGQNQRNPLFNRWVTDRIFLAALVPNLQCQSDLTVSLDLNGNVDHHFPGIDFHAAE